MSKTRQTAEFLKRYTEDVAPLYERRGRASWDVATTGDEKAAKELATTSAELERLHADPARHEELDQAKAELEAAKPREVDPLDRRALHKVGLHFAARKGDADALAEVAELEAKLSREYGVFRGTIDGEPQSGVEIGRILRGSDDAELRKKAWEASQQVGGEVREQVIDLVERRNAIAKELGWRDAYAMRMELQELDEDWLFGLLARLERASREPFRTRKAILDGELAERFGVETDDLRPWHYSDPFFQRAPEPKSFDIDAWYKGADLPDLATRFFDGLGMNVRSIVEASDLEPREGKNEHAFCTHIDRSGDIRMLANLEPSRRSMTTLLHELGHAVYERYLDKDLPWTLRGPSHILTTEAIAMLMGRQASNPDFLIEYVGAPAFEVTPLAAEIRRQQAFSMLLLVRWVLVMVHFEKALYEDPRRDDLDAYWWELKRKYQLVNPPDGERGADWAAKIHLALAPVYYHNYLLGELMASQLATRLLDESDEDTVVDSPYVGESLISRVFQPGGSVKWDELVESATGEPLAAQAFLDEFVGRRGIAA